MRRKRGPLVLLCIRVSYSGRPTRTHGKIMSHRNHVAAHSPCDQWAWSAADSNANRSRLITFQQNGRIVRQTATRRRWIYGLPVDRGRHADRKRLIVRHRRRASQRLSGNIMQTVSDTERTSVKILAPSWTGEIYLKKCKYYSSRSYNIALLTVRLSKVKRSTKV